MSPIVTLRVSDEEKSAWLAAAGGSRALSAWLRTVANASLNTPIAKKAELKEAGKANGVQGDPAPLATRGHETKPPVSSSSPVKAKPKKKVQGCWDHRDSPKSWCVHCQSAKGAKA